jgi:NAD(P)-dependent dehydrogenase (short-subunit alcohol dehydrogenase family)
VSGGKAHPVWDGATVAVTGAASGIGEALARRFAAAGARVAVVDLDGDGAGRVASVIGGLALEVDMADEHAVASAIDRVEVELGPITLFASNAGVGVDGGFELPTDEWQRLWDVNVMAHVHVARVLVPRWLERGGGHLLVTASAAGLLTQIGSAPYTVTKAGAVALAEWLTITYGDRGVIASALCPQAVRTAMTAGREGAVESVDGMLEPDVVADAALAGLAAGAFLILPHAEVRDYVRHKADDRDRWIRGMRRLQSRYGTI